MSETGMVHRAPRSAIGVETEELRKKLTEVERELAEKSKCYAMVLEPRRKTEGECDELHKELAKARADAALQHASAKDLARQFNEARAEVASTQQKTYAACIRTCECLLGLSLYNEDFKEGVRRCKGMHQAEMENGGPLTTPLD